MPLPLAKGLRPKLWLLRDEASCPSDPESTVEQMTGELVVTERLHARWEL